MRIIIAGAGELGRLLASTLSNAAHDVTIIDSDADMLEHINDNLDIKVVEGSCISINTLKDAGIKTDVYKRQSMSSGKCLTCISTLRMSGANTKS